jgi:hypothetical protein
MRRTPLLAVTSKRPFKPKDVWTRPSNFSGGVVGCPVSTSQIRAAPTTPVATRLPSGLNSANRASGRCLASGVLDGRAPIRFVARSGKVRPNIACDKSLQSCDGPVSGLPVCASQTRPVRSQATVRTRWLSGLNRAYRTASVCCNGGVMGWPVRMSHTRAVWSADTVTRRRPSGLGTASRTLPRCSIGAYIGAQVVTLQIRAV